MEHRIWSFGAKSPTIHLEQVREAIFAAHRYKNALVAQEHERRKRVHEATCLHFPRLLTAEGELAQIDFRIGEISDSIRRSNAKSRSRSTGTKEQKAEIAALRSRRKEIYAEVKKEKKSAYGSDEIKAARKAVSAAKKAKDAESLASAISDLESLESAWFAAVPSAGLLRDELANIETWDSETRKSLRAECGVYWGTYLSVEDSMQGSRSGAPPQFRRWEGHGKIAVQFQGGLTAEKLLEAQDTRMRIEQVNGKHWLAYLRIGSERREPIFAGVPFILHRDLPDDATAKWAYLIQRRIGTQTRWELQVILSRESWRKDGTAESGNVGIDVGWRRVKEGLRVAYWVGSDGQEGQLVLPDDHIGMWKKAESLQSICSRHMDYIRPILAKWMREQESLPEWFLRRFVKRGEALPSVHEAASWLLMWKSSARLAALIVEWRGNRIDGDQRPIDGAAEARSLMQLDQQHYGAPSSIYEIMEAWRKKNKHLTDWVSFQRQKAINRRMDTYRKFADMLRKKYGTAHVEDVNWSKAMRLPQVEDEAVSGAIKEYQRVASVGLLLRCLSESMAGVVKVSAEETTSRCAACGEISGEPNPEMMNHTCTECGETYDQDKNAARNLLRGERFGEQASHAL